MSVTGTTSSSNLSTSSDVSRLSASAAIRSASCEPNFISASFTGGSSFENHAGRCYPWQINDPSLGQAHTIYQIQNKEHKLVFPTPYTTGKFQMPPWFS